MEKKIYEISHYLFSFLSFLSPLIFFAPFRFLAYLFFICPFSFLLFFVLHL